MSTILIIQECVLPFLLTVIVFCYLYQYNGVVASSPPFVRQEIKDGLDDWIYSVNASYAPKNVTTFPNLETASYSSDGKFLNATLWLTKNFEEKPSKGGLDYLMYIDVDSNNKTGFEGADYAVLIRWDNNTNTWFRDLVEFSAYNKDKVVTEQKNYTGFFDVEKNSVFLSIKLDEIGYPNQYNVAFSVEDSVNEITDTTAWLPIPPPIVDISTLPSSLVLRPGDEKTIELRVNSSTNLQPEVLLHTNKKTNDDVILDIRPNRTYIPSYGFTTSQLHVKVLQNAKNQTHTLPIFADMHFPLERLKSPGMIINKTSFLTISVLPSLTVPEYINDELSIWGSPVKQIIGLVTAIGSLGFGGLILNKIRKKRQKDVHNDKNTE